MKDSILMLLVKMKLANIGRFFYNFYKIFKFQFEFANTQNRWRIINKHNHTKIGNSINEINFPIDKVTVGKYSYGSLCVHHYGTEGESLKIGNYCSVASGVKFILGGNHAINTFSTYPFRHYFNNEPCEATTKGAIIVEDDVWIGTNSIILSGVTLGKGTIVAAGSVVAKSTIPYSIIGGNPAKLIKMRFDETIIKSLMDIDFNLIDENKILNLIPKLYKPLNKILLNEIENELLINKRPLQI